MEIRSYTRVHPLISRVVDVVRREGLIRPNDRVLAAVSGGPDSVCLLTVLTELRESGRMPGLQVHVAHVNYGLRGKESDQDEAFVRELAARFGAPVSCTRVALGSHPSGSLQRHARDVRYAFFERVLREYGLTTVATGHTADDQAETILMWLLRGTGTVGLAGIPVMREGRGIIRPLLGVNRSEALDYLRSWGIPYRIDASNATAIYRRNRIRHEVLPLLRSFNPRIVEGLARQADILAAEAAILDEAERERWRDILVTASPGRVVVSCKWLVAYPLGLRRRLVRRALASAKGSAQGFTFRHVSQILGMLEGRDRRRLALPRGFRVGRDGDHLTVEYGSSGMPGVTGPEWQPGVPLSIPGEVHLGQGGRRLIAAQDQCEGQRVDTDRSMVVVDADRLGGPLTVRSWKAGDWFCPSGMGGHRKKLQDFFVDEKIPRNGRDSVPLVVAPVGIVWVVGYRGDERFTVRAETLRTVTLFLKHEA